MSADPSQKLVTNVSVALIDMGERLRVVDAAFVEPLAASIKERGLDSPIHVMAADASGRHRLISGAHRLAAVRRIGWDRIPAFVRDLTGHEADLAEVDENLVRRDLSPLDRAVFLARRKELYQELFPETRRGRRRSESKPSKLTVFAESFSRHTKKRTGMGERDIEKSVRRAERIPRAIRERLAALPIVLKAVDLDALAALEPGQQADVIALLEGGEAAPIKSVRLALKAAGLAPEPEAQSIEAQVRRAIAMLEGLSEEAFAGVLTKMGLVRKPAGRGRAGMMPTPHAESIRAVGGYLLETCCPSTWSTDVRFAALLLSGIADQIDADAEASRVLTRAGA